MKTFVPKKRLERAADKLLAEFFDARSAAAAFPIPLDDIVEAHFGLTLDFEYLEPIIGRSDVLGATFVQKRTITIDRSLDPVENPGTDGRMRFTVAHEIAHWYLHAAELRRDGVSHALRTAKAKKSDKDPLEWQADYFASCLLMPRTLLVREWEDVQSIKDRPVMFDASNELARRFDVSEEAMRIRLREIGLVTPGQ